MANNQVQLKDKNNNKCYPNPYWPIGSIFLSMNNTNPSTYFGGTWQLIGQGRTLVGVDTGQTEFNTVGKTGGNKTEVVTLENLPLQTLVRINPSGDNWGNNNWGGPMAGWGNYPKMNTSTLNIQTSMNNLQPYLTCYIWNRIS